MIKILKYFSFFSNAIRISEIRNFVESGNQTDDARTFVYLLKEYSLLDGLKPEDVKHLHMRASQDHISTLFDSIDHSLHCTSTNIHPDVSRFSRRYDGTLMQWLSNGPNSHYSPKPVFHNLCVQLTAYADAIEEYGAGKPHSSVARTINPISSTLKDVIAALAHHKYGMEFEGGVYGKA